MRAGRAPAKVISAAARDLRLRFDPAFARTGGVGHVTHTHIGLDADPVEAWEATRRSAVGDLLPADGSLLNDPDMPWYPGHELEPRRASLDLLRTAYVTASTWPRKEWGFAAATLELRFVFGDEGAWAFAAVVASAWPRDERMMAMTFDRQQLETGYEGEQRASRPLDLGSATTLTDLITAFGPSATRPTG